MAICSHLAPNNEKSILYQQLEQRYGSAKAHDMWTAVYSQQFVNKHGDFRDPETEIPLDANGEPELSFVEEFLQTENDDWIGDQILAMKNKTQFDDNYTTTIENYLMPMLPEDSMGTDDFTMKQIHEMVHAIRNTKKEVKADLSEITNHSGGAIGSDSEWDKIGREFGVINHKHYWHGKRTPAGNVQITDEQLNEGWNHVLKANESLNRKPGAYKSLLSRNWFQVKNADAVFAIGTMDNYRIVNGGTGWAVQMAIDSKKPIYVYEQRVAEWRKYDYKTRKFEKTKTPSLTKNFAGIGTREINSLGKEAIRDVYKKTKDDGVAEYRENINEQEIVEVKLDIGTSKTRISPEDMLKKIKAVYDSAVQNPDKIFSFPYKHEKDTALVANTKYTSTELANLFDSVEIPVNVRFTDSMRSKINNSSKRILSAFQSDFTPDFIKYNEDVVKKLSEDLLVRKVDSKGEPDGFFTADQHTDIVNTITAYTERLYRMDSLLKENSLIKVFGLMNSKGKELRKLGNNEQAAIFESIQHERVKIAESVLYKLDSMGLKSNDATKQRILAAVEQLVPLTEEEKEGFVAANPEVSADEIDVYDTDFLEAAGRIGKDWSQNSFELNPRDTASARIKLFLGNIFKMDAGIYTPDANGINLSERDLEDITKLTQRELVELARSISRKGFWYKSEVSSMKLAEDLKKTIPYFPLENFMGLEEIADGDEVFSEVLSVLGDKLKTFTIEDAVRLLSEQNNPTIKQIAKELAHAEQSMKNEFMTVMMKQHQQFVMIILNTTRGENGQLEYSMTPIESNRYSQRMTLVSAWQENQKLLPIMVLDKFGNKVLDTEYAKKNWIPLLESANKRNDWTTPEARNWFVKNIGGMFRELGISVTNDMMNDLFENPGKWTDSSSVSGLFYVNKSDSRPSGLISIFIMVAAGMSVSDQELSNTLSRNNPLYDSVTKQLAKLVAKYTPVLWSFNHKNTEGKTIYDWGLNTKLSNDFRIMKQAFPDFMNSIKNVDFSKHCWLVDALLENPTQIDEIELAYLDGFKVKWQPEGSVRQDMSDREQLITAMTLFQNTGHGFNRNMSRVNYMSLTHSDKTTTPVFRNMPKVNTGRHNFTPNTLVGTSDSAMFKLFRSEYDRIINQSQIKFNNSRYNKGKHLFYMLPEFNYDNMKQLVQEGSITNADFQLIWPAGERELTHIIEEKEMVVINKILDMVIDKLTMKTFVAWYNEGIVSENGNMFDKMYVRRLMSVEGITSKPKENRKIDDKDAVEYRLSDGSIAGQGTVNYIIATAAAKDYAVNSFLFNTALSQLFYGDPAESYKGSGNNDMDDVRSTMIEYRKRLAKDIAPRTDMYWGDNTSYNSITLSDVKTKETYLSNIEALAKAYGKGFDATDAQELVTVQEKLDVLYAAGKINDSTYLEMSAIINNAGPGNYYEFDNPEHLKVIMQPDKPVYAGFRTEENGARLTDYVKSSSYALYPPFLKNRELDNLRQLMEKNSIARADFESARKLGTPSETLTVFSSDGSFIKPDKAAIDKATKRMDRAGFGIQQEQPYDEEKEAIKIITQMNEGITEGISELGGFVLPDRTEPMSGVELKSYKESIRKKMLNLNLESFLKKFNIDETGSIDNELINSILAEEARKKGYTLNELQSVLLKYDDGTEIISRMFNTAADKFERLLMSMVNNISTVKMPGKSYIQASSVGLEVMDPSEAKDVVWVGDYDGSSLKGMRLEDGKIKPGQVILPFNFYDNNGKKLRLEDFVVEENGKKILDSSKIPPELLKLVGARIPNQKHSSMHPLEIVGFVPDNMGDIIFIPSALVKQMGGDFDVDKLYTYKKPYFYNQKTATLLQISDYKERLGIDDTEKSNIREDVKELFDSNPELANQVYTVLGFDSFDTQPMGTINVYWGQAESNESTRILSNLAPRKFTWNGKEYGSVEHAYQSNKSGVFDATTYNAYNNIGGYGKKIKGKGTIKDLKAADSLTLMRNLVIESFRQNRTSEAADKLLQYKNFTHNTNELIDKAFLEGLKLAQKELLGEVKITPQQKQQALQVYSQYLDTIFPDSQVKDIVYHGSPKTKLEKVEGISFWTNKEANAYAYNIQRNDDNSDGFVTSAIVNIKNLFIHQEKNREATQTPQGLIKEAKNNNADGAIWKDVEDLGGKETQTIVFEPEQIHILGSKQDVEGFREFVQSDKRALQSRENANEESMEVLQSKYFDVHWSVLTHPEMITTVMNPLDKDDLKNESELLASKSDSSENFYDPIGQLEEFQNGKSAKKLVGASSWAVKMNARMQTKNMMYGVFTEIIDERGNVTGFTVKQSSIKVLDEHTGKIKDLTLLSGTGKSLYSKKDGDVDNAEERTKGDNHVLVQSESVDNGKYGTLNHLNLNSDTYKAVQGLIELQTEDNWAANSKYWTRLLTQPIIKEYSRLMKQSNDALNEQYNQNPHDNVVQTLKNKYGSQLVDDVTAEKIIFSPQLLLKAQTMEGNEFVRHQLAALDLFDKLHGIGDRLLQLESVFTQDVSGAGPSLFTVMDKLSFRPVKQLEGTNSAPIMNEYSLYADENGNMTEAGATFDILNSTAINVVGQVFPYMGLTPVFDQIAEMTATGRLTVRQRQEIVKAYRSYVYTKGTYLWRDAQEERVRLLHGEQSLARRIVRARNTWGKENVFLNKLREKIGESVEDFDFVQYVAGVNEPVSIKQDITVSWLHMLLSKDEEQRKLGEDLVRYSLLTGGVQDANSFIQFLPVAYLAGTEFNSMLRATERQIKESQELNEPGFVVQFLQHNPGIAPQLSKKHFGNLSGSLEYPETFHVNKSVIENFSVNNLPRKFLSYRSKTDGKWILYQRNGTGNAFFYTRIDTLGDKFTDEYNGHAESGQRSILQYNRSLAEEVSGNTTAMFDGNRAYNVTGSMTSVNHFEEIGIRAGGITELNNALGTISEDKEVPEYLRIVAEALKEAKQTSTTATLRELSGALNTPFSIKWKNLPDGMPGYSSFQNEIILSPFGAENKKNAAEVLLHEVLHNKLQWMVLAGGYDTRFSDLPVITSQLEKFRKENPEIADHLKELDKLRYKALQEFRNSMAEVDYRQIEEDVANEKVTTEEHGLYYALHSLQEFVAHIMTSKEIAGWLNTVKTEDSKSMLEKIWDLFARMIKAFSSAIGFQVKDGTVLKESLVHIFSLLDTENRTNSDITSALLDNGVKLVSSTEQFAIDVKDMLNKTYHRDVDISRNGLVWEITVNSYKKRHSLTGQRGRILDRLYEQADDINSAIMRTQDMKEKTALRTRHREVKDAIYKVHQSVNVETIAEIGKQQLKWVDNILNSQNPTTLNVNMAIQTAKLWESLIDILYGPLKEVSEIGAKFIEVQTEAQKQRIMLVNDKARKVITDAVSSYAKLTPLDFGEKLTDMNVISANVLSLTRAKSSLVNSVTAVAWRSANNRDEEIYRNSERLKKLSKLMDDAGLNPENMLQLDELGTSWGLVNRLSAEWSNKVAEDYRKMLASLASLDKMENADENIRTSKKHEIWNNYWKEVNKESVFVDIRHILDIKTGERVNTPESKAALEKLIEQVGDSSYAEELIKSASSRYKEYLSERESMYNHVLDSVTLTKEEETGKSEEEKKVLLSKLQNGVMAHWLKQNSPIEFLDRVAKGKNIEFGSESDSWLIKAPRKEFKKYYDEKYDSILSDKKKLDAYNQYKAILTEMISYLPTEIQMELTENFFPVVPKDTVGWLASLYSKIKNFDKEILNAVTATDMEMATRLRPDKIPVIYTKPTSLTKDVGDRSTDLIRVLELFSMMALHHKHMGSVLDTVNIAESVLREVDRQRMNKEATGKSLRNTIDALKYFKDMLIFKKPKELEGKVDSPIYSLNPVAQYNITKKIQELIKERAELQEAISTKMIEGDYELDAEEGRIKEIDRELTKYELEARNIYASKLSDMLISINQLKGIGYNPFSAVSNYTFAEISLFIHGRGRVDYTPENLRRATLEMMHAAKKYWTFGSVTDSVSNKIHGLMSRTGIMGDVVDTEYGAGPNKRKTRTGTALSPYNWQRSGDYFTKGKLMISMLLSQEIEVTDKNTSEVKKIPLYEAFNSDGEWDVERYGENTDWDTRNGGEKFILLRDRMRKVSMMVFGNQDKNAPLMAKKNWLWRLAGQFRLSWFPEGIASRLKAEYHDPNMNRTIKGRWRSYSDVGLLTSSMVIARQMLSVLPGVRVDAFNGLKTRKGTLLSESPVDIENMRKNFSELAWMAAFTATIIILRSLSGDDEDKNKKHKRQLLVNMLIRNQQDLLLYASPAVFNTISGNFLPASQVIVDYWNAMKASVHYIFGDTSKEKHAFDTWLKKMTRAGIPHPSATLYNKFETMMTRDLDKINR